MIDELIIEPGRTERQYWRDLWRYRELFYFLAWRDILVRFPGRIQRPHRADPAPPPLPAPAPHPNDPDRHSARPNRSSAARTVKRLTDNAPPGPAGGQRARARAGAEE